MQSTQNQVKKNANRIVKKTLETLKKRDQERTMEAAGGATKRTGRIARTQPKTEGCGECCFGCGGGGVCY